MNIDAYVGDYNCKGSMNPSTRPSDLGAQNGFWFIMLHSLITLVYSNDYKQFVHKDIYVYTHVST